MPSSSSSGDPVADDDRCPAEFNQHGEGLTLVCQREPGHPGSHEFDVEMFTSGLYSTPGPIVAITWHVGVAEETTDGR